MNKVHYVVYWDDENMSYTTTTPRDWAREFGQNHNIDGEARTSTIENYLKSRYRFVEFTYDTAVVLCQMDTITPNF